MRGIMDTRLDLSDVGSSILDIFPDTVVITQYLHTFTHGIMKRLLDHSCVGGSILITSSDTDVIVHCNVNL